MTNYSEIRFEIVAVDPTAPEVTLKPLLSNEDGYQENASKRLYVLLKEQCRSVVIEHEYIDADFKASYSRFYYLRHRDIDKRCKRLHFFACVITLDDLYDLSDLDDTEYLGFVVVRPLPAHRMGRSILSHRLLATAPIAEYARCEKRFLTCKADYTVNLAGHALTVIGSAWMQQDTMVSACASAALWIANSHMSSRFPPEFRHFTTPRITDLATQFNPATGRAMPSEGLTVEQMMSAMKSMGYEPILRFPISNKEARRICYKYMESSIPVTLVIQDPKADFGHALTIVGHNLLLTGTYDLESVPWNNITMHFCRTSDFVPRFIAQDDTRGPFRFVEFLDWDAAIKRAYIPSDKKEFLSTKYRCVLALDADTEFQQIVYLRSILVALPPRVTLGGRAAERQAMTLITRWYDDNFIDVPTNRIALRTLLQPSNSLKRWWHPRYDDRPGDIGQEIRLHLMSKWIWITEFSDIDLLLGGKPPVLGQVIQDSAGHSVSPNLFDLLVFSTTRDIKLGFPDGQYLTQPVQPHEPYSQYTIESKM